MRSIDKADAIKKRFIWDNQSVCLFSFGRKHGEDSNKFHLQTFHRTKNAFVCYKTLMKAGLSRYNVSQVVGKPFIVQRMPYPVTKP